MDNEIKKQIESVCTSLGMELHSIKPQRNKIVSFRVKSEKVVRPNQDLYKLINELDFVKLISQKNFTTGKKVDNCCWYSMGISITDEYFNGVLDTNTTLGRVIEFFIDNNVKSAKDFLTSTFNILKDMQVFTRTTKDRKSKKTIWRVKYHYLKFLYKNNLIEEVVRQKSYCDDDLVRFKINGEYHWLRTEQADFISCVSNLEVIDEIYTKQHKRDSVIEVITENKEFKESDFDLYIDMFRQLNNDKLLLTAGMDSFNTDFFKYHG